MITAELVRQVVERHPLVTVIGDVMLDGWFRGDAPRMSREAPVPVVEVSERHYAAGGAANTALNLAALGARVRLVGLVGTDAAADRLLALLTEAGVDVTPVVRFGGAATAAKTRIVSGDQVIVRLDEIPHAPSPAAVLAEVAAAALASGRGADAEIVCDYGLGAVSRPVREALEARAERPGFSVVDAHDAAAWRRFAADLVTPNGRETALLLGTELRPDADRAAIVERRAGDVLARSGAAAAVVTLDRDGTLVVTPEGVLHRTQARPVAERQASGAGDTFVAALTLARIAGLPLDVAASFGQAAADVVVQHDGTTVCTPGELLRGLAEAPDVIGRDALLAAVAEARAAGCRVVFTNGCFDVLHRGHTTYLRQARALGDLLVVAVNSDASARRLKGPGRPINAEGDRAAVLASLGFVDYVTVFDEDTPSALIEALRPDIYAKGGDYSAEMLEESEVVRSAGGEVRILGYVAEHSTSELVSRIRGAGAPAPG
ncbi:D-glycero-beta-D-manno-heptose 1-phosphate adenylyltransferase [Subtercola sp. Z020]|uniref:D-glycero-beta-D-manno-heptose 1-phosphate adenylyltransferase n=1 Tax=Subtercola sp. Z020 TaxID=2080582 RepID=UPI001E5D83B7|nr:D-glycero-beta-D-manno-heptose 1-phosphate adenylyltransferase [Subtercola sp. Z020]